MKKIFTLLLIIITNSVFSQNTLYYPVDIVYNESSEEYYVANWADGDGYILTLNSSGEIIDKFAQDLTYPGGLCLIGNTLYVDDNLGLWSDSTASYLKAYDITSKEQILNELIVTPPSYLDLMTTDNNGFLYFGNSVKQKMYKYNIATHELSIFLPSTSNAYGVFYDEISDRILYTESSSGISYIRSINTDGTNDHPVFYVTGYLEGIAMEQEGNFYFSSWGTPDAAWGNEPVYKSSHNLDWKMVISNDNNRPYGMCIGKDNFLAVCNWGNHTLKFLDLSSFSVEENTSTGKIKLYPNPSNEKFKIELEDITSHFVEIFIFDLPGKLIYSEKINIFSNKVDKEFQLMLQTGAYIVKIKDGNNMYTKKLMIN